MAVAAFGILSIGAATLWRPATPRPTPAQAPALTATLHDCAVSGTISGLTGSADDVEVLVFSLREGAYWAQSCAADVPVCTARRWNAAYAASLTGQRDDRRLRELPLGSGTWSFGPVEVHGGDPVILLVKAGTTIGESGPVGESDFPREGDPRVLARRRLPTVTCDVARCPAQ